MAGHDDELSPWGEDPLVRALRAPGTSSELAGEQEIVTAYRRAMPRRGFGRVVGRLGAGGTAIVTTIALSSGVAAAAYTQNLPDPVQSVVHSFLGPVGVPAARPSKPIARPPVTTPVPGSSSPSSSATPNPSTSPSTTPLPSPAAKPSSQPSQRPAGRGDDRPSSAPTRSLTPAATPTSTSSATPSPDPGPTNARRVPFAVTITPSASSLSPGEAVTLAGVVTSADGKQLSNRTVRLKLRTPGVPGWVLVARGRTGTDGSYSLSSPGLNRTSLLRVIAGNKKAKSTPVRVVVQASLAASWSGGLITITSTGAQPGDVVDVLRRKGGHLVKVRQVTLDANASVLLPGKQLRRSYKLRFRLPPTRAHGTAVAVLQVPAAGPTP